MAAEKVKERLRRATKALGERLQQLLDDPNG
jgi:hypothetical protein